MDQKGPEEKGKPPAAAGGASSSSMSAVTLPAGDAVELDPVHNTPRYGGTQIGQQEVEVTEWEEGAKRLGSTVALELRSRGRVVSNVLCAFVVRWIAITDPQNRFNFVDGLSMEAEKTLVQLACAKLDVDDDPIVATITMQVVFESVYARELLLLQQRDTKLNKQNNVLLDKVVAVAANLQSRDQVSSLYRAIFKLLLKNSHVEDIDRLVEREIAAALDSVFPQTGLNPFSMLNNAQKRANVAELVNVVMGIRLFNQQIGKGGAGLGNVPEDTVQEATDLLQSLRKDAHTNNALCQQLSDVIELEHKATGTIVSPWMVLQAELTNRRQYVLLVHQLQYEVSQSLQRINQHRQELQRHMDDMKDIVGNRATVPKDQVYPKFHDISRSWLAIERERHLNAIRGKLFRHLSTFRDDPPSRLMHEDVLLVEDSKNSGDTSASPLFDSAFDFVRTLNPGDDDEKQPSGKDYDVPVRLTQQNCARFLSLPLQYQGYCCWTIIKRARLLLPGDPQLGIIRFHNKYYSFATLQGMKDFVADPERHIEEVEHIARAHLELIHLLCLQEDIPHSAIHSLISASTSDVLSDEAFAVKGSSAAGVTKTDAGVQTPVHIVDKHIDHQYDWNEWNWRRKALQLANLTNRRTHSTQTEKSHFRRDAEVQSYVQSPDAHGVMPGVGTQTGISKGTNAPRVSRFVGGMKGPPSSKFTIHTLRLDDVVTDETNRALNAPPRTTAKLKTKTVRVYKPHHADKRPETSSDSKVTTGTST